MSILAETFMGGARRSLEDPRVPITAEQLANLSEGGPTRAGVRVNEHTALTYMAVYTAVKIIAESLGNLPLQLFRRIDDDRAQVVRDRKEAWALSYPNEEQTASVFKETIQAWQCLWGNGYARILDARTSLQLLPLRSDRVRPERQAGKLVYRVEGEGPAQTFQAAEILHLPGLSMNGITGLSPIGVAREAIAMGKAAEIFGAAFYGNGANVGGLLTHPAKLKPEAIAGIEARWRRYQGAHNAHRIAVMDEGVKFEKVGMPLTDAQFLESRKFQVIEIARLYRVPPHMLMDLERSTNNNIEQQSLEFLQYCLGPWLTKWEEELTRKLFGPGSEYFIAFDLQKMMLADRTAQQAFFTAGRQWGFLSANDIRRMLNMNPIDGGDMYLTPINMAPAERANDLIDAQISKASKEANKKTDKNGAPVSADQEAGLNGAQITAAVDIVSKLRSGLIAPDAAVPLFVALGIPEDQAKSIAKASPARGNAESDKQFLQELTKSLAANPATTNVVANSINIGETVGGAGAPVEKGYEAPWLPVTADDKPLVTGETVKDTEGSVVGGAIEDTPAAEPGKKKDGGEEGEGEEKFRKLGRRMFASAIKRMVRKETNALRRAAEKPENYTATVERFYAEHRKHLSMAITEQAEALAELLGQPTVAMQKVIENFADEAVREIKAAAAPSPVIEHVLETREETYPAWAAGVITKQLFEAWKANE